jgi:alkylated DNA repair dioxygenase AlkB
VLVAEYAPGTPLGWHRDVPDHEDVFGVSLGSTAVLRLRPYPPVAPKREDVVKLRAAPRSIYALRGPARWGVAAQRGAGGRTALVDHAAHGAPAFLIRLP